MKKTQAVVKKALYNLPPPPPPPRMGQFIEESYARGLMELSYNI